MHRLNECVSEVTGIDPELAVIPPKGRSFQASFADQAHVAEARAQAQVSLLIHSGGGWDCGSLESRI